MKTSRKYLLPLLFLLLGLNAFGQSVKFSEHRLKNGLRVILAEDHSAPTYSIAVTYNVGSRDEKPGRTGFAHLFEHMMFQGSDKVGKGEHFLLISNNGGAMNGSTTNDRTNYFETLPANQIDLGLFLEADRMRSLAINQANLDNQRATVQEEKRQSYDNQPYGHTFETILNTAYDNFAYKHTTIGSMEDLNAATLKDVTEFFRIYYAPNNAVLSLVGDFKTAEVLAKVEKYFGDIPSQPAPPVPDMTEPKQTAERRQTIEDPLAQLARLSIVYKIPPGNTPDWYSLYVAGEVLAGGESSRLYQELVKDKEVATNVGAGPLEDRGPSLFFIQATLRPGVDPAVVEKMIYEDIERLKSGYATDNEFEKLHMELRRDEVQQLSGTLDRATQLGEMAVFFGDPDLVNKQTKTLMKVTRQQVQQAVRTYLIDTNRTVVTTVPKEPPPVGPAGQAARVEVRRDEV